MVPSSDMIREAHELGLLTTPYVFDVEQAEKMTRAGADIIVAHMGLTTSGSIGAQTALTLEESAERVQAIADAARSLNPEVLVICHGGSIAEPEDAAYIMEHTQGVDGFFGASSIERLAAERGIREQTERFKAIKRET